MDRVAPALRKLVWEKGTAAWLVVVLGGLLVGGCNVFNGFSPAPNSVDVLVADAQTALAEGDASRAVHLLERAFKKDSTDVRVRVELGNALFAEQDLDVFSLRVAAEPLIGSSVEALSASQASRGETTCTEGACPETSSERYDAVPVDTASVRKWAERAALVRRVQRLVGEGVLERRRDAFTSTDVRIREKGLLVGAVATVANGVIDVHTTVEEMKSSLYLDHGANAGRALVACAGTKAELAQTHDALCSMGAATHQGRQWLQTRNQSSAKARGSVLIERLEVLADASNARIDCS